MEKELCTERHKRIDERLDTLNKRVNSHSERLDRIEQAQSEFRIEIKNLCENLKSLTAALKWFIGLLIGSFVAFFFYAIQNNIFK